MNTITTIKSIKTQADTLTSASSDNARYAVLQGDLVAALAGIAKAEAVSLARELGIVRKVTTRDAAVTAITRKVFEMRLAHESIAY